MQEDRKVMIKMLNTLLEKTNLISLSTKIDLESDLISVTFSALYDDIQNEGKKEILTSGFSKNEIENLKEQYATCGNQIRFGISSSTEDQDRIR